MIGLLLVLAGLYAGAGIRSDIARLESSIAELKELVSKTNNCNPAFKQNPDVVPSIEYELNKNIGQSMQHTLETLIKNQSSKE